MRSVSFTLAVFLLAGLGSAALAEGTCSDRASQCDQFCASRPAVYPFTSPYNRCAASCEPRWQQCLRTGVWVHLEGPNAGLKEHVDRFY